MVIRRDVLVMSMAVLMHPIGTSNAFRRVPGSSVYNKFGTDDRQRHLVEKEIINGAKEEGKSERREEGTSSLPNAEDHLVTSLPYLDASSFPTSHYAGHIPASGDDDKKLFYWLFAPDFSSPPKKKVTWDDPNKVPLLIWLNGGPGCSSMDGLFLENGPFRLTPLEKEKEWKMEINPHSWHKSPAWTLYIDQPVGTGLSFTKKGNYCKNDYEVDVDFHLFLENFIQVHSATFLSTTIDSMGNNVTKLNRPLYFSGESHAGHYIPSMMDHILRRNDGWTDNDKLPYVTIEIPISGAAIGNGWMDPYHQYAGAEVAYGMGFIDLAQKAALDSMELKCQEYISGGNLRPSICFHLLDDITHESHGMHSEYKVSQYDSRKSERKSGGARSFPFGHKRVEQYLGGWSHHSDDANDPPMDVDYRTVLDAIHASESLDANQRYQECTDPPFDALSHQDALGVVDEVVRILDHPSRPKLLFFNGMNDLICNHVGNEVFLNRMSWGRSMDWMLAVRYAWMGPNTMETNDDIKIAEPVGFMKEFENLMFLKVLNAGHMVPMDQPEISLEMMRNLMYGISFLDSKQQLNRADPTGNKNDNLQQEQEQQEQQTIPNIECQPCPQCKIPEITSPSLGSGENNETTADSSVNQRRGVLIAGGWMGAIVGLLALVFITFRNRRSRRLGDALRDFEYDVEFT